MLLFAFSYGIWWTATGNDPREFFRRMMKPDFYIAVEPQWEFNKAEMPIPKKERRTKTIFTIKKKKKVSRHIHKEYKFLTYGQIEIGGKEVGFYLLKKGPQAMFVFEWEISGGHDPSMEEGEACTILDNCTNALNNIPRDIDLKFYGELEKSCQEYKRMQASLLCSRKLDPLSIEAIRSRTRRAEQLAAEGRLLKHKISVLAKYRVTLGGDYAVKMNWLDDLLSKTKPLIGAINGQSFDSKEAWEKVIGFAYSYAYKKVNFMLSNNKGGFGVIAKTKTVQELFERDYLELHKLNKQNKNTPRTPQYIVYNEWGLSKPVVNQWGNHAIGTLFESQGGLPAVPKFDKHLLYCPLKNKYAGFVRIGQIRYFPKERESVELGYLKYLWNILAGKDTPIYDCKLVSEITADRSGFEIVNLDNIISHSLKREALAARKQTVDVVATRRREQAISAREELANDNIPFWVSIGIWLYRDSPEELEQELGSLSARIMGAASEREENCLQNIWLQNPPFEWESFLTKPDHRRQKYISYQTVPLIPMVKTGEIDKKGAMLVTRELNTPIYIDFANEQNHTAIVAKTGTGKSNLILDILLEYIIQGYTVVLFDFPRQKDGTSTFTVLIPLLEELGLKVAYHNVRKNVMNIIELPDLRHIKDKESQKIVLEQVYDNHVRLLSTIVMGSVKNPDREMLVSSLLTDCYTDFHEEEEIKKRYEEAIAGGYGSKNAHKVPIYEEFLEYAEKWFIDYIDKKKGKISVLVNDTIDIIVTQLRAILKTPLGRSINGISSFDTNLEVLVIGLTNVSESTDSLIYSMSGLNALYRASFSAKRSLLGIDEGTILYKFEAFARETGTIPVHGRKWSCNFLIAAQEITTILESCSGGDIFKNLDNILSGHIASTALPEMTSERVGFRKEILKSYTSKSFKPSKELLQSYWYLKRGDQHIEVTHPGSELLLGLGVTNEKEEKVRKEVLSRFKGDKIAGLKEFSRINAQAKRTGISMESIY